MRNILITGLLCMALKVLSAQQIVTFEQLAPRLTTQSDTVFVVNFWATWCAPCVAELHYFEELTKAYKDQKVKVFLVSLDFKSQVETKVIPFLQKRNMTTETLVLAEKDPNKWVGKVDETWTGSIPATLIFNKENRVFFERQLESYAELEGLLSTFTNN